MSETLNRVYIIGASSSGIAACLDGDSVIFTDGAREQVDGIIYATSYKITFLFFKFAGPF